MLRIFIEGSRIKEVYHFNYLSARIDCEEDSW